MVEGLTLFLAGVGIAFVVWWAVQFVWMLFRIIVCKATERGTEMQDDRLHELEGKARLMRQNHNELFEEVRQMRPLPPEFRKAKRR